MTDLKTQGSAFCQFIEDTINEALADPSSLSACLAEADGALRCLEKILSKLGDLAYAQFIISPLYKFRFEPLRDADLVERKRLLCMMLGHTEILRSSFLS